MTRTSGPDNLVVRQHERHCCRVTAKVRVASENADRVTFSRSGGDGEGRVPATLVDISSGGLGFEAGVFLPRTCRIAVRIEASGLDTPLETVVRIQRVLMTDRKPTYYLGTSFTDSGTSLRQQMTELLEVLRASGELTPMTAGPQGVTPRV